MTFTGITAARQRLARLVTGLRAAAAGDVVRRAAAKVGEQIAAVAEAKTSAHQLTGAARESLVLTVSGGLVELTSKRYLSYHGWWPFRRGVPPFVVKRAAVIFARELLAALGEQRALGGALDAEAAEVVGEAEAGAKRSAAKKLEAAKARRAAATARKLDRERGSL